MVIVAVRVDDEFDVLDAEAQFFQIVQHQSETERIAGVDDDESVARVDEVRGGGNGTDEVEIAENAERFNVPFPLQKGGIPVGTDGGINNGLVHDSAAACIAFVEADVFVFFDRNIRLCGKDAVIEGDKTAAPDGDAFIAAAVEVVEGDAIGILYFDFGVEQLAVAEHLAVLHREDADADTAVGIGVVKHTTDDAAVRIVRRLPLAVVHEHTEFIAGKRTVDKGVVSAVVDRTVVIAAGVDVGVAVELAPIRNIDADTAVPEATVRHVQSAFGRVTRVALRERAAAKAVGVDAGDRAAAGEIRLIFFIVAVPDNTMARADGLTQFDIRLAADEHHIFDGAKCLHPENITVLHGIVQNDARFVAATENRGLCGHYKIVDIKIALAEMAGTFLFKKFRNLRGAVGFVVCSGKQFHFHPP